MNTLTCRLVARLQWTERVLVVCSQAYAKTLQRGLEHRLATATAKLQALTPPRGRGKRQIKDQAHLQQAAQAILQAHRLEGLLSYTFERQEEHHSHFVGRGRGGVNRPCRVVEQVRYQITSVVRHDAAITALKETLGWRAYATDVPAEHLTLEAAVLTYRDEWVIERGFHRLKGAPPLPQPLIRQAR
jgi:transposase